MKNCCTGYWNIKIKAGEINVVKYYCKQVEIKGEEYATSNTYGLVDYCGDSLLSVPIV